MSEEPIFNFEGLKTTLKQLGYTIGEKKPYNPIQIQDVTFSNIQSGEIEITSEGIFYINPETKDKQQIFLYKREYFLRRYGKKPRFHICNCEVIQEIGRDKYRRANTGTVIVYDNDMRRDVEVSGLPICKKCLRIINNKLNMQFKEDMTSVEFEKILREFAETEETETDLDGYIWKWQKISEAYRTKKNYTCEKCGFTAKNRADRQFIHVHHKDGRKTNNKESNLQCLCIACHADIHKENFSKGANKAMLDKFKEKHTNVLPF